MSYLADELVEYAQNKNTNKLIAVARAAGVTKTVKEIVKAGEAVSAGVGANAGEWSHEGAPEHPANVRGLVEQRAEQQAAALLA